MNNLSFSSNHEQSVPRFGDLMDSYLASRTDTMPRLEALLSDDPDMPMALMFRGCLLKLAADPRFRDSIDKCIEAAATQALNDREARHLQALGQWQAGDMIGAAEAYDDISRDYPADIMALRMAHYLYFYTLGADPMLRSINDVLSSWQPGDRFYGYLMGMLAFAHEEAGHYDKAEFCGHEALRHNPADIWAAHAVTHVYQMQERFEEGLPFIASLTGEWGSVNNFVNHMHWHNALQHIGAGQPHAALDLYDRLLIKPLADDFYLDICNAASLLWRLDMLGLDTGDRWEDLLALSRNRIHDDELVFTSLHYLMAPAVLGDETAMDEALDHYRHWAKGHGTQAIVTREIGEPMARAIVHFGRGEHAQGSALLQEVESGICRIGGSHAQRNLFNQLLSHYQ